MMVNMMENDDGKIELPVSILDLTENKVLLSVLSLVNFGKILKPP